MRQYSVLVILSCLLAFASLYGSAACAGPNIINGKTPDDIDEAPCSESELMDYVEKAKKAITSKWSPAKGFEDRNAVAVFTVTQNGKIENSKIIESSGSQVADESALKALKAASPLTPLPKGAPESIQIRYVFSWHVTHNYSRTASQTETNSNK